MRLRLISFILNDRASGMGRWSHEMAAALKRRGHDVALEFSENFPRSQRLGRAAALTLPAYLAAHLERTASEHDAVVLHEPLGYWYARLRKLRPRLPPLLLMCHNAETKCWKVKVDAARRGYAEPPSAWGLKARAFRLWQSDGAIARADRILCLSTEDRRYIEGLGVAPERVTSFVNGVGTEFVAPARTPGAGRVLFVGGWFDIKGSRVLPRVWANVVAQVPSARLTLVGTHASEAEVLRDFDPAVRSTVQVQPRVEAARMPALFAAHDVFVMPSLLEGSPLSLLEAMASGLVAVASRVGGVPDIVTHGVDGLLFESMNVTEGSRALIDALTDSPRAAALAAAAKQTAQGFTWDKAAEALERAAIAAVGVDH